MKLRSALKNVFSSWNFKIAFPRNLLDMCIIPVIAYIFNFRGFCIKGSQDIFRCNFQQCQLWKNSFLSVFWRTTDLGQFTACRFCAVFCDFLCFLYVETFLRISEPLPTPHTTTSTSIKHSAQSNSKILLWLYR